MSIDNIDDANYIEFYKYVDSNFLVRVFQIFKYKFILKIPRYVRKNSSIIDVGCGSGKFLANMKRYGYTNLCGIDLDDTAFHNHNASDIAFIKQSITEDCNVSSEVVFVQSVLHHIPTGKLVKVADNLSKMVNNQGYLLIYEPNIKSYCGILFYKYFLRLLPRLYKEAEKEFPEHIEFCEVFPKFIELLKNKGFRLISSSDWAFYNAFIFIKN